MKGALSFLLAVVLVHAARGGGAPLAPSLESYLESGSRSDAELTAVAEALLAKSGGLASDFDSVTAAVETGAAVGAGAGVEASSSADTYSDSDLTASIDLEADMPRDTQQQEADERNRRDRNRNGAGAGAGGPNAPPPGSVPAGAAAGAAAAAANPTASAVNAVAKALGTDRDRDDIVKLVYDELHQLGASPPVAGPFTPSASGITDPRIQTLERRLGSFERQRVEESNRVQDKAINSITQRLLGFDKMLTSLKRSVDQQTRLSNQLSDAAAVAKGGREADTRADESVVYQRAELPENFESRVRDILASVKREARRIYERYCRRKKKRPTPSLGTGTPKKYPKEITPPPKGLVKPKIPKLPAKLNQPLPKPKNGAPQPAAAAAPAPAAAADSTPAAAAAAAVDTPAAAGRRAGRAGRRRGPAKPFLPKPVLFKPVTIGKEPVATDLRLAKTLHDISEGLSVIPAYQLGEKEKALQDVLGEEAVGNRWKSSRP